ncbi:MAG TPA: CDP-alcohol phosphatidyltransferase family protein [Vicinamibacterales bacterium]|nr:CDP-alcohol phosphatidyltransferase family protein [Vicinamibacterales bacterium]
MPNGFVEAQRNSTGLLTTVERRALIWLAHRMPARVNSDHLTALGLASMFLVGVCFAVSRHISTALWGVVVFLALNWFGDSLDGTLARVRGHQRPRYGFYVDHILDTFGALFVIGGLAVSGAMTPIVAAVFLVAYYLLSIEVYLATYCVGRFQMSFWGWGPTELRILLAIGALALFVKPIVTIFDVQMQLFDVGGIVGTVGLIFTAIVSAIGNTRRLYAAEPLPQTLVSQRRDAETPSPEMHASHSILLCELRK